MAIKGLTIQRALRISLFGPIASLAILICRWVYVHATDQDFFLDITNYVVVFIPFAFSIFFAFVPDMRGKHIAWRLTVVALGVGFSVVLWEQQHLASQAGRRDQNELVTSAVQKSNEHSDKQIGEVRGDLKTQETRIENRLDSLESHLSSGIDKFKPSPPKLATLQFSFLIPFEQRFPMLLQSMRANSEGVFDIEFACKNVSRDTAAEQIDLWMYICKDDCRYQSEPAGFQHIEGTPPQERHLLIPYLNHDVTAKWKVSVYVPPKFGSFETSFKYLCKTCIEGEPVGQNLEVMVIPPFTVSEPKLKPKAKVRP
jgi:hypothetical protein